MRRVVANITLFDRVAEQVALGKDVEIPTKGSSMLPFIVGGRDSVVVGKAESIALGDIVLAKLNDQSYVLHRVYAIEQEKITLMGDGNIRGKEYCTRSQICAKAKSIIHKGKSIDCNAPTQQRLSRLWCTLLPVRRYILGIWRRTPFWPQVDHAQKNNLN